MSSPTTLAQEQFESAMLKQAKPRKFYLVWRPTADAPQKRHDDHDSAIEEAKRIAQKHRGDRVYVLVALAECVCDDIHVTRLV